MTDGGIPGLADGLRPMLATPGRLPPVDAGWAYEMKWDGLRALSYIEDGQVRLVSRTGRDISAFYPELDGLVSAVRAGLAAGTGPAPGAGPTVLDGEIVAFGGQAWPSFEMLQQRMNVRSVAEVAGVAARVPVTYLAFDLLCLDGRFLLGAAYQERRALLDGLGLEGRSWQTPPAFTGERGADVLAVSRQHNLEGVVAKRLASRYEPGHRSASWIKVKNVRGQEVVVGGWKPGERGRTGQIGSLLIGVHGPAGLQYAGHVGTGFTQQTLRMLAGRLEPLRRDTSPFATEVPREHARLAVWAAPQLVIEVAFTEWTSAGRLRAPSYKGLRPDKDASEVVREP